MKPVNRFAAFAFCWMVSAYLQSGYAQEKKAGDAPKVIEVELRNFKPPTADDKDQIEQWLLEIDLVPILADRIAFTATGTYFLAGKGKEEHISNLRQYAVGWCLDNRQDRERLIFVNQRLLNPNVIDQGKWRLMQSGTSELDRLRIKSLYHESNGTAIYEPNAKSRIQESLETAGVFFPSRAAMSNPTACWSGQAMDRSKPAVTIDRLRGIQRIKQYKIALFEYRPADYYVFFVGLVFRDGLPVQCDSWRQFRRQEDIANKSPTPEQTQAERDYLMASAKRVARVQSKWKTLATQAVPIWIHGVTLDDFYDVELVSEIEWHVNEQVDDNAFNPESVGQMGPLSIASKKP